MDEHQALGKRQLRTGIITTVIGAGLIFTLIRLDLDQELFLVAGGVAVAGILAIVSGALQVGKRAKSGFVTIINDFGDMPKTMKQLAVVQFFSGKEICLVVAWIVHPIS